MAKLLSHFPLCLPTTYKSSRHEKSASISSKLNATFVVNAFCRPLMDKCPLSSLHESKRKFRGKLESVILNSFSTCWEGIAQENRGLGPVKNYSTTVFPVQACAQPIVRGPSAYLNEQTNLDPSHLTTEEFSKMNRHHFINNITNYMMRTEDNTLNQSSEN
jgi:hypothetical protein